MSNKCELTVDRSRLLEADAVVFKDTDMSARDLPPTRYHWQRYVFYGTETIHRVQDAVAIFSDPAWRHFFNWTASYRLHSDIFTPYHFLTSMARHRPGRDYMGNKSRLAAWVASNCDHAPSRREVLVQRLRQFMPIDILGACGSPMSSVCENATAHSVLGCLDKMASTYKFYLALENDLCQDWVTEKYFLWIVHNIIVVHLADRRLSLIHPGSAINVLDFNSSAELAARILELANNRTSYNNFFKWRDSYNICRGATGWVWYWCQWYHKAFGEFGYWPPRSHLDYGLTHHFVCGLCFKLHNTSSTSYSSYPDIREYVDDCQTQTPDWREF